MGTPHTEPDDLDRLIADSMRDPEFARAFLAGQERDRQAAYERGVAEGLRRAVQQLTDRAARSEAIAAQAGVASAFAASLRTAIDILTEEAPDA